MISENCSSKMLLALIPYQQRTICSKESILTTPLGSFVVLNWRLVAIYSLDAQLPKQFGTLAVGVSSLMSTIFMLAWTSSR